MNPRDLQVVLAAASAYLYEHDYEGSTMPVGLEDLDELARAIEDLAPWLDSSLTFHVTGEARTQLEKWSADHGVKPAEYVKTALRVLGLVDERGGRLLLEKDGASYLIDCFPKE